ncbi:MAG: hypothetical protein ACRBFS_25175 [Aureispira sp.]
MSRPNTPSTPSIKEKQELLTIQERLVPFHAYILPVFGVVAAFVGPWLLVGLLYLVLQLMA